MCENRLIVGTGSTEVEKEGHPWGRSELRMRLEIQTQSGFSYLESHCSSNETGLGWLPFSLWFVFLGASSLYKVARSRRVNAASFHRSGIFAMKQTHQNPVENAAVPKCPQLIF